jgi:hypothetical protein
MLVAQLEGTHAKLGLQHPIDYIYLAGPANLRKPLSDVFRVPTSNIKEIPSPTEQQFNDSNTLIIHSGLCGDPYMLSGVMTVLHAVANIYNEGNCQIAEFPQGARLIKTGVTYITLVKFSDTAFFAAGLYKRDKYDCLRHVQYLQMRQLMCALEGIKLPYLDPHVRCPQLTSAEAPFMVMNPAIRNFFSPFSPSYPCYMGTPMDILLPTAADHLGPVEVASATRARPSVRVVSSTAAAAVVPFVTPSVTLTAQNNKRKNPPQTVAMPIATKSPRTTVSLITNKPTPVATQTPRTTVPIAKKAPRKIAPTTHTCTRVVAKSEPEPQPSSDTIDISDFVPWNGPLPDGVQPIIDSWLSAMVAEGFQGPNSGAPDNEDSDSHDKTYTSL